MKHYRISIDVDIEASSRGQAEERTAELFAALEMGRGWLVEVLPNGMQERIALTKARP